MGSPKMLRLAPLLLLFCSVADAETRKLLLSKWNTSGYKFWWTTRRICGGPDDDNVWFETKSGKETERFDKPATKPFPLPYNKFPYKRQYVVEMTRNDKTETRLLEIEMSNVASQKNMTRNMNRLDFRLRVILGLQLNGFDGECSICMEKVVPDPFPTNPKYVREDYVRYGGRRPPVKTRVLPCTHAF